MKVYRELSIDASPAQISQFPDLAAKGLPAHWSRDLQAEAARRENGIYRHPLFAFDYTGTANPQAKLCLVQRRDSQLQVSNIVPDTGTLTEPEFNGIMERFHDDVRAIPAIGAAYSFTMTTDTRSVLEFMSEESAKKLRSFSAEASHSTGSSHPPDRARWCDFIISAASDAQHPLQEDDLIDILVKEEGWPEFRANELAAEFSVARDTINAYRQNHQ